MAKLIHLELDVLMNDDTLHENVRVIGADRQRWTEISTKERWPSASDDEDLWMRFLAWAALHRTGAYAQGYDSFCLDVSNYMPTEDVQNAVDPTRPTTTAT